MGCNFRGIPFPIVTLEVITIVPFFKSEAGVNRNFLETKCFVFVAVSLLFFDKFHCFFISV